MQRHIIMSGIPASGKSTVGQTIAAALGLAFLDKDQFLEAMFNSQGVGNAEWRRRLSRAADEILREKALCSGGAVITSWWRHPLSRVDSGTPVEWLAELPGVALELHCVCTAQVAARRFLSRKRHEGHLDHLKTRADVLANFQQQAAFGPLRVAPVVAVNTERSVEISVLIARINSAFEVTGSEFR